MPISKSQAHVLASIAVAVPAAPVTRILSWVAELGVMVAAAEGLGFGAFGIPLLTTPPCALLAVWLHTDRSRPTPSSFVVNCR